MNRFTLIFISFFLISQTVVSQKEVEFLPSDWENQAVFEKGQTAPHAFYIPYISADDALKNKKSPFFQLLNGQWKFKLVNTPDQVPEDFWNPKYDVKEWAEIKVPSNWQMEGYDHPKFRNIALTFESDPPKIPSIILIQRVVTNENLPCLKHGTKRKLCFVSKA
jgi:beta-galactosidase